MQSKRVVERTLWALWLLMFGGAALWVVVGSIGYFTKVGWLSSKDAPAWVQAVGSILAIFAAALIASSERRFTANNIRAREKVVIRAVEERSIDALGAIRALNYTLRTHFRPVTLDSPINVRASLDRVEVALRDLRTIDLMSMPNTGVVECVLTAVAITQQCQQIARDGWDPRLAINVNEYSPLEVLLVQMELQISRLRKAREGLDV